MHGKGKSKKEKWLTSTLLATISLILEEFRVKELGNIFPTKSVLENKVHKLSLNKSFISNFPVGDSKNWKWDALKYRW